MAESTAKPAGASKTRRAIAITLGLAVSALFLVLLLRKTDLSAVWSEVRRVRLGRLSLSLCTMIVGFLAMAARSQSLFRSVSDKLSFFRVFKSVMLGYAANNVLPLRAGELLRIHYLARHGDAAHSSCFAVVAVERLFDLLALVALFFSLLPLVAVDLPPTGAVAAIASVVALGLGTLIGIARWPEGFISLLQKLTGWMGQRLSAFITDKARLFAAGTRSLRSARALLLGLLFTGVFWGCTMTSAAITLWAFELELAWTAPAVVLVFGAFAVTLPSSPGYVGTYHYFVALSLRVLGVKATTAASFAIVVHAFGIIPYTALSVLLLAPDSLRGELVPAAAAAGTGGDGEAGGGGDAEAQPDGDAAASQSDGDAAAEPGGAATEGEGSR